MSEDHKPNRPDEMLRIEKAGGCVLFRGTWRVGFYVFLYDTVVEKSLCRNLINLELFITELYHQNSYRLKEFWQFQGNLKIDAFFLFH